MFTEEQEVLVWSYGEMWIRLLESIFTFVHRYQMSFMTLNQSDAFSHVILKYRKKEESKFYLYFDSYL